MLRDGSVYTWGKNQYNQLGFEDNELVLSKPTLLLDKDKNIESIMSSNNFNYAVNYSKQIFYSWGMGDMYVLGNFKDGENQNVPYKIDEKKLFQDGNVRHIELGSQHVCLLMKKIEKETINNNEPISTLEENKIIQENNSSLQLNETCDNEFEYDISPFLPKKGRKKKVVSDEKEKEDEKNKNEINSSKKKKIIVS